MSLAVVDAPALSPCPDPVPDRAHPRWAFWRSPPGQPGWARPILLGITALAALLYAWNITKAGYAPLYAQAVHSMSGSWKAFLYGAYDARATVTLDKLAGSFLPQALAARIFGYHAWSLALPQVIEGVIAVLVMYRVVRRWAGVPAALLAAGIFTLTPVLASMFGHSMEDGALTMCLVLAADSYQRAVTEARLRSLVYAGLWVGLGFQAKMLQAWVVVPALALGYLVAAPAGRRRRLWHLAVAGVVMLAVSLSWVALYTFTPARDRPYISGSTDNSAVAMVFGWNGLGRFGIRLPGAPPPANGNQIIARFGSPKTGRRPAAGSGHAATGQPSQSSPAGQSRPASQSSAASQPGRGRAGPRYAGPGQGWTKLLGGGLGPQIGWLYPLALLTLICGLLWRRRAPRTDQVRGGLIMWGTWLLSYAAVFSALHSLPHTAYVAALAPPLAALSGAGIVLLARWYTSGDRRGLVLPFAVAAELAWAMWLWSGHPGFLPWVRWAMLGVGVAAIVALIPAQLPGPGWQRLRRVALAGAVAAMLAGPATWAASVLDEKYAGSSFDASAGPPNSAGSVCILGLNGKPQPGFDQGCPASGAVFRTGRPPSGNGPAG